MTDSHRQLVDALSPQTRVWFPDKDKGWLSGHVTDKKVDGDDVRITFADENGKVSGVACLHFLRRELSASL